MATRMAVIFLIWQPQIFQIAISSLVHNIQVCRCPTIWSSLPHCKKTMCPDENTTSTNLTTSHLPSLPAHSPPPPRTAPRTSKFLRDNRLGPRVYNPSDIIVSCWLTTPVIQSISEQSANRFGGRRCRYGSGWRCGGGRSASFGSASGGWVSHCSVDVVGLAALHLCRYANHNLSGCERLTGRRQFVKTDAWCVIDLLALAADTIEPLIAMMLNVWLPQYEDNLFIFGCLTRIKSLILRLRLLIFHIAILLLTYALRRLPLELIYFHFRFAEVLSWLCGRTEFGRAAFPFMNGA